MVLLAAAVCTKTGKPLLSRQFVEMTRSRIEGLLAAFPKLLTSGDKSTQRQHTFIETESVRYVYQPIDQLYVVLITTKASNILEDLETLRLFSRVIPEYCKSMEEKEILDNAFQLIFAFDEIVALGYRESVNLAQIRTFTDMDSHEERVYYQIKKSQEEEAKKLARDKAREFAKAKQEAAKRGGRPPASLMTGYGPQSARNDPSAVTVGDTTDYKPAYTPQQPSRPIGSSKAMRLGGKAKDVDSFVDQLKSEGQEVIAPLKQTKQAVGPAAPAAVSTVKMDSVHLRMEEKINLVMSRDGGLQSLEVHGMMTLRVTDEKYTKVKVRIENNDKKGAQLQTHPNLDKKAFQTDSILVLKSPPKPFPVQNDVGVLKWRFQTTDEAFIPLSINCWPSETGQGCEVNIEYTLESNDIELRDVVISIPLPHGVAPVVGECEGEYRYDKPKNTLEWRLAVIDRSNKQGSLEFTTNSGHADNFFPVKVSFASKEQFCDIKPGLAYQMDDDSPVKFSQETSLVAEKYEIV